MAGTRKSSQRQQVPGQPGPGRNQSRRARTSRTRSIQSSDQVNNLGNSTIPQRGRELPAIPDPPRICNCHAFLGACLFVSPAYVLPAFSGSRTRRNGTEWYDHFRLSVITRRSTSHNLSNHPSRASAVTTASQHHGWWFWATDPRPHASRQQAGISEAKQLTIAGVSYGIISTCVCGQGIHE